VIGYLQAAIKGGPAMGLVTQRNQKLEKLFNDLAIDPKEKAKEKAKSADQTEASDKNKQ
jgi:hypothetical protein